MEDVTIYLFTALGFLGSAGLFWLLRRWARVWRVLLMTFWAFLVSSAGGITTRLIFNDLPKGSAFARIFSAVLIIYGVYAFTMFAQGHTGQSRPIQPPDASGK
jgi:CHASE2 domain-containing sensor protein